MEREINKIIIHCSATPAGRDVTVSEIDAWHRRQGYNGIGYHYVVGIDGVIHRGRPLSVAGAHCRGYNANSVGVCYVGGLKGGVPADTRTGAQKQALRYLVTELCKMFPGASVHGHNEFAAKACPCFNVKEEYYV